MLRDYSCNNWTNLEPLINQNDELNSMFGEQDPDVLADKILTGLNKVVKELITIKRVQKKKNSLPYWTNQLTISQKLVKDKMTIARLTKNK